MYLFDRFYRNPEFGNGLVLVESVLASFLGIGCGFLLFPAEASLIGVFLVAFAQARTVELLLDRNRDEIWGGGSKASTANVRLAISLLTMFLAILGTYAVATLVAPEDKVLALFERQVGDFGGHSITDVRFDDLTGVLGHNLIVLAACFLFSLLYRHGGMLLVLAWNASVWGVVFPYIARTAPDVAEGGAVVYFLKSFACIFPHLLLEASGYVLVAMAGVFLSKGLQKYEIGSPRFNQVGMAVLRIVILAVAFLGVASVVEAWVAPALIHLLF
jgi:hypothetical protein